MSKQVGFTLRGRNPDVLTCIANLSNDEVFTPPRLKKKAKKYDPTKEETYKVGRANSDADEREKGRERQCDDGNRESRDPGCDRRLHLVHVAKAAAHEIARLHVGDHGDRDRDSDSDETQHARSR